MKTIHRPPIAHAGTLTPTHFSTRRSSVYPAQLPSAAGACLCGTASSASLQTGTRYQNETCPNFLNSVITFSFCPARPWCQLSSCRNGFKQGTGAIFSLKALLLHPVLSLSEQPQLLPQHPIIPVQHGARAGAGRCPAEREGVSSGKHASVLQEVGIKTQAPAGCHPSCQGRGCRACRWLSTPPGPKLYCKARSSTGINWQKSVVYSEHGNKLPR